VAPVLIQRILTGVGLIVLLIGIVVFDDAVDAWRLEGFWRELFLGRTYPPRGLVLFIVALVVAPLAAVELSNVFRANGILTRAWLTAAAAVLGLVMSYSVPMGTPAVTAIAVVSTGMIAVFIIALLTFSRHRNVQGVLAAAGAVVFATVYLGLMLGFFLALRREHTAWWIVGIILTTKSSDIGAYFTGSLIGRRKLIPWLSPGKTWEGLCGGIVASMLAGLGFAAMSALLPDPRDHVPLLVGLLGGGIFALVGQFGDLTMSLFKRGGGMKDSSRILPGMGGVLDVLDSPLMVAPIAYWLLVLAVQ
jgi:phosphatidate cytidylyltransferase